MHIKVYICLFTFLAARAINLEIVEDLSTSFFLQALRRHGSLFATPHIILSDNAQMFKRAEKDLQILLSHFELPLIQTALTHKRIRFLRIPTRSPHWGVVYETMIGLMKSILKEVLGRSLVLLAELSTLVKEIQAVLNDRPLTVINTDIHELQPLTLNHLLFGFNVKPLPHPSLDSDEYDPNYAVLRPEYVTQFPALNIIAPRFTAISYNVSTANICLSCEKLTLSGITRNISQHRSSKMVMLFSLQTLIRPAFVGLSL